MTWFYINLHCEIEELSEKEYKDRSFNSYLVFGQWYDYYKDDSIIGSGFYISDYSEYLKEIENELQNS